jgi:hypothetical protein
MVTSAWRHAVNPLPSRTVGIDQALAGSEPLALLTQRLQASRDRLAVIQPLLPPAMRAAVQAGPIDDQGWSILVSSHAVAAKLRHMVPALDARLLASGFNGPPVRVKLLNPG